MFDTIEVETETTVTVTKKYTIELVADRIKKLVNAPLKSRVIMGQSQESGDDLWGPIYITWEEVSEGTDNG